MHLSAPQILALNEYYTLRLPFGVSFRFVSFRIVSFPFPSPFHAHDRRAVTQTVAAAASTNEVCQATADEPLPSSNGAGSGSGSSGVCGGEPWLPPYSTLLTRSHAAMTAAPTAEAGEEGEVTGGTVEAGGAAEGWSLSDDALYSDVAAMARDPPLLFSDEVLGVMLGTIPTTESVGGDGVGNGLGNGVGSGLTGGGGGVGDGSGVVVGGVSGSGDVGNVRDAGSGVGGGSHGGGGDREAGSGAGLRAGGYGPEMKLVVQALAKMGR